MTPNLPAGLLTAAVLATLLGLVVAGVPLVRGSPRRAWPGLALLVLVQLPMCWLALTHVRPHWEALVRAAAGDAAFWWLRILSAPVTEELAKAWPLLCVPRAWRRETPPVMIGMALGLGFGLGEAWTIAAAIAPDPKLAALPWHQLLPFVYERAFVCLAHGAFTSASVVGLAHGRAALGLAAAMALHLALNFPILLAWFVPPAYRGLFVGACANLMFFALILLLVRLHRGNWRLGQALFGDATCPDCALTYPRPLLGLNAGPKRYEQCPGCRAWHWL